MKNLTLLGLMMVAVDLTGVAWGLGYCQGDASITCSVDMDCDRAGLCVGDGLCGLQCPVADCVDCRADGYDHACYDQDTPWHSSASCSPQPTGFHACTWSVGPCIPPATSSTTTTSTTSTTTTSTTTTSTSTSTTSPPSTSTTTTSSTTTTTTPTCPGGASLSPIVNGTVTSGYPSTGALLSTSLCSGTLIGCETFLTAGHCVEGDLDPQHYTVFLQHAGFFTVASISLHPGYNFPVNDVAVLTLSAPVTGIAPSAINTAGNPPFGTVGEIVGFGRIGGDPNEDFTAGVKQVGHVTTATCTPDLSDITSICWNFDDPLGPAGEDSNTCQGDSGGPLFIANTVAGTTSGARSTTCLPPAHTVDANVYYYRQWIQDQAGADLNNTSCGRLPQAGHAGTEVLGAIGALDTSNPAATYTLCVPPDTSELRIALNGTITGDADLYVKAGSAPTTSDYTCRGYRDDSFEFCDIPSPPGGTWYVMVQRASGLSVYQLTATTFSNGAPICGNNVIENGEACDGTAPGACVGGCDDRCACVPCTASDLSIYNARLARKFVITGLLRNRPGLDPRNADFTLTATDADGDRLQLTIPAGDAGWSWNPRKGLHRWRGYVNGLRVVKLRGGGGTWALTMKGKNVTGASAIGFSGRRYTLAAGGACAAQ